MSGEDQTAPTERLVSARWSERHPAGAALLCTGGYLAISLVGYESTRLRLPVAAVAVLGMGTWVGMLLLSLLVVLNLSRLRTSCGYEVVWVLGLMALFFLARPDAFAVVGRLVGNPARGREIAQLLKITPEQQVIGNIALILWAIFLGRLVSRVIREGKLLLPVAVVASIADIITVFWGVVHEISQKAPEVVETFSAQTPVAVPLTLPVPILTAVGIGDFLFLALFLTVAVRYAMNDAKAVWATFAIMLAAPVPFVIWPDLAGLPGLPLISLAVLGANWRYLRFSREEKRALAFAGVLVIAVAAWIVLRH